MASSPRVSRTRLLGTLGPMLLAGALPAHADVYWGVDSCSQGYVWREPTPTDHACVIHRQPGIRRGRTTPPHRVAGSTVRSGRTSASTASSAGRRWPATT